MLALALASQLVLAGAPAQLTIDIQPAGVEVKLDGKKVGTSGEKPLVVGKLKAGVHVLRVEHKGDAHEEEIALKAGEKKTFVLKLEDGRKEPSEPSAP
jgi:hypothetical protein